MAYPSSASASTQSPRRSLTDSIAPTAPSHSLLLHVDGIKGDDGFPGTANHPLRTITQALHQAKAGTLISISPGDYSADMGEHFPLMVNHNVMLSGADHAVRIMGGGPFTSQDSGSQIVTLVVNNDSTLRGLTITNPQEKGTGVWVERGQPTISNCQLYQCQREGMVVSATGHPIISQCKFEANAASGLLFLGNSSGIVDQNRFTQANYGVAIGDRATPQLRHNDIHHNRTGLTIAASAQPILRSNAIHHNQASGVTILNEAQPDLGTDTDPGNNIIVDNGSWDIHTQTDRPLVSHGNRVRSDRLSGPIRMATPLSSPVLAPTAVTAQAVRIQSTKQVPGAPSAPVASPASTAPSLFPDLQNHWAQSFIESLHQHTIIQGFPDGTFKPEQSLTRAQYAALLHKMFSLPPFVLPNIHPERPFQDVSPQFWAAEAIQHASRMGFIAGFPDGTFRPEEDLSRAQAIVSIVNGLQLSGGDQTDLARYGDRTAIHNYAKDEVATATQKQLIVNYPDPAQLSPKQPISRAEIATMLYQIRVITGQSVAIASPYLIQPTPLEVSFEDVPSPVTGEDADQRSHWATDFIYGLANQGLIRGSSPTTFAPERAVSRAEFAALLTSVFNPLAKESASEQAFVDVSKRFWGHDVVQRVVKAGLMTGFDDGSFQPHQDVMRWQVFLSVTQALGLPSDWSTVRIDRINHFYSDVESIPDLAKGAIATATAHNLVVNYPTPNRINASRGATRAEVAAILYQSLVTTKRLPPLQSLYIVSTPLTPTTPVPPVSPAPSASPAPLSPPLPHRLSYSLPQSSVQSPPVKEFRIWKTICLGIPIRAIP